jgi:hypothetical protein
MSIIATSKKRISPSVFIIPKSLCADVLYNVRSRPLITPAVPVSRVTSAPEIKIFQLLNELGMRMAGGKGGQKL